MKKFRKVIAMAALLLTAAIMLSGCYVEPSGNWVLFSIKDGASVKSIDNTYDWFGEKRIFASRVFLAVSGKRFTITTANGRVRHGKHRRQSIEKRNTLMMLDDGTAFDANFTKTISVQHHAKLYDGTKEYNLARLSEGNFVTWEELYQREKQIIANTMEQGIFESHRVGEIKSTIDGYIFYPRASQNEAKPSTPKPVDTVKPTFYQVDKHGDFAPCQAREGLAIARLDTIQTQDQNTTIRVSVVHNVYYPYIDPNVPENPTDPNPPIAPENPTDPNPPIDPENPTDPNPPVDPENPTDPNQPIDPEKPTEPNPPIDPENPTDPNPPIDPEKPTEPNPPIEKATITLFSTSKQHKLASPPIRLS